MASLDNNEKNEEAVERLRNRIERIFSAAGVADEKLHEASEQALMLFGATEHASDEKKAEVWKREEDKLLEIIRAPSVVKAD